MSQCQGKTNAVRLAAMLVALLLSGCAATGGGLGPDSAERRAEMLAQEGRHSDAAGQYIGMAAETTGPERVRLTLLAVEQWLDAGDGRRARTAMAELEPPADEDLRGTWDTNRAAILLWEGKPDAALDILRPMASRPQPVSRRIRIDTLRGDAWFQKNDPVRAVNLYLQLEQGLVSAADIQQARERLWAGLLVSDVQTLRASTQFASSALIRGWLELGAVAVSTGRRGIGWSNAVESWRGEYPEHPALSVIADHPVVEPGMLGYPQQVALLLPVSGDSQSLGDAIRHGFLAAYFQRQDEQQEIRVYDVAGAGDARSAYRRAVADGAEFIVGPLMRDAVSEIASSPELPVPVLTLNYLPDGMPAPPGLFQFALSPEDEAIAAAARAVQDGHTHGLALIPDNDWGRRLLASFVDEFQAQGGTLLEYRFYRPSDQDFSFEIQNLMGLALSIQRHQRLRANLGQPIEFEPRRRADAQFIFLAAEARAGRLLKSQLKFHYSGELPVYSTSRIFEQDGRSNLDLDGVGFADAPWAIAPRSAFAELPAQFRGYWPDKQSLLESRLNAMGYDAYYLVGQLRNGGNLSVDGASGALYLDDRGRIRRRLPWAHFENGQPVTAPAAGEAAPGPAAEETLLLDGRDPRNPQPSRRGWAVRADNP